MSFSRVLVTGGCGFIGSNLVELLRKRDDCRIRVLDNETTGARKDIADFGVEFIAGDVTDPDAVKRALDGVDVVVHLAAHTRVVESIAAPEENFRANVLGTLNVLCKMREGGVKQIVSASTGGAILGEVDPPAREDIAPAPLSPYGASKLAAEGYCSAFAGAYGFLAASLRFSNVYGPRSYKKGSVVAHFFKQILAGEDLTVYGDGTQTRDYVFVQDVCEGIWCAMKSGANGVFQLGTGVPTTLNELIAAMQSVVGNQRPIKVHYAPFRTGELRKTWCDIGKARRELGYDPQTPLSTGLERTWEWFQEAMAVRVTV